MSAHKYITIWCDVPACNAWDGHEHTATEARRHAKRNGWTRIDGLDICPHHKGHTL